MADENKGEYADAMMRAIERELAEKRVNWTRQRERNRTVRMLAFSFLSLIIFGAVIAFMLLAPRAGEMRSSTRSASPSPTPPLHRSHALLATNGQPLATNACPARERTS